ncbi:MAG TPA: galactokinase [Terrimicrobiaceae bacterium]|nr:galactokinase [Terrimicrobiaceae bacterium]
MQTASAFAPGRVELLGNHTDYNGGVVLSAAIDLGISARGRGREDGKIVLTSEGIPGVAEADVAGLEPSGGWSDYPLGVARVLKDAGFPVGGFSADYSSTLPLGAGLSSSAAIEVCTAVLLSRLFGFSAGPLDLAKLCRKAENEFVGVNCGLLDQVSSIFGKKDHAVFLDCRAETVENIPFPAGVGLLIVHSGVKHALTGGEYNERREQCFEAARILGVPALRDATSAQLAGAGMPDLVRRRALHITGENERVFAAVGHLRQGDAAAFGKLMTASHGSSMANFENSTAELDVLVEIACAQDGVHGARLTGGGFGGAIVALVDLARIDVIAAAVESEYRKRTGHAGQAYRCLIGDGALSHA